MVSFSLPPMLLLAPVAGAIIVYLFLRLLVWSRPDATSVESHGLWVGIIGWMASSLQGAMSAGIIRANPAVNNSPSTPDQLFIAFAWPVLATLTIHALGQSSYPAPKAQRRYAELTVRRVLDVLPRRLAWTTAGIAAYAAVAIAWIAALPAYAPVLPSTPPSAVGPGNNAGYGQDGRIAGSELAAWLGASLLVLVLGTWLVLIFISRRRQLETLDGDDNRMLRTIAANRLLRTVATMAAGLATIAGNFAALPAPGALWQPGWVSYLGFVNMAVLLVMWWWKVPSLPSLEKARRTISGSTLRADPRTHGAARLTVSLGAVLGLIGGIALAAGFFLAPLLDFTRSPSSLAGLFAATAGVLLLAVAGGEVLVGRNYGDPEAPVHWPVQPVSNGLLSFGIVSVLFLALAISFSAAGQSGPHAQFGPRLWLVSLAAAASTALAAAVAILATRLRPGIPEREHEAGLDAALRSIALYRIVRILSAYCLGQAAVLLITSSDAWYRIFPTTPGASPLGPSPAFIAGIILAVAAVITAVTPVRSLFSAIPRDSSLTQAEPSP
ncbi:hypothetical protein AB0N65_08230 [Paenarthrobacter sp. NPDC089322]|uniref:hypothetical protein n=1 Tax=Paenarthrobacter sp. NPDC089322 TaxID=3155065 RepID=UPI003420D5FF